MPEAGEREEDHGEDAHDMMMMMMMMMKINDDKEIEPSRTSRQEQTVSKCAHA